MDMEMTLRQMAQAFADIMVCETTVQVGDKTASVLAMLAIADKSEALRAAVIRQTLNAAFAAGYCAATVAATLSQRELFGGDT